MGGFFDIDPKLIKRAEQIRKLDLDEVKRTIKSGSGEKPEYLKIYNAYYDGEPITARKYVDDENLRGEIEFFVDRIFTTKQEVNRIFHIDIESKHAAKIVDVLFFHPSWDEDLSQRKDHFNKIVKSIKVAHSLSDAKIRATIETLESLDIVPPPELETIQYVKKHYAKNQLKQAVIDAASGIFPQINNKIILDQIATKALQ